MKSKRQPIVTAETMNKALEVYKNKKGFIGSFSNISMATEEILLQYIEDNKETKEIKK